MKQVQRTGSLLTIGLLWAGLCLSVQPAGAQTVIDADKLSGVISRSLDAFSRDRAEEYLDILERLQDVLDDYQDYIEDYDEALSDHEEVSIGHLQAGLRDGRYLEDPEILLDDIYNSIDNIKKVENRHRILHRTNNPRCCKVARNLRREMTIVAELAEDYANENDGSMLHHEDIRLYLAEAMEVLNGLEGLGSLEGLEALKALEQLRAIEVITDEDEEPFVFMVPEVPRVPSMRDSGEHPRPPAPAYPLRKFGDSHRQAQMFISTSGSIDVDGSDKPVMIINPVGTVIIVGTDEDKISATMQLGISASSKKYQEAYSQKTKLTVIEGPDKFLVEADLPRMSDYQSEVVECLLEVSVPASNLVECRNAFGQISASELYAGIRIESDNAKIRLQDIEGEVRIANANGSVFVTDVIGDLEVVNSYGPIEISDCEGDIKVANAYHSIHLWDNKGEVRLENSGEVEVIDHEGSLVIENSHGRVELRDIDGDVVANNAYEPLIVVRVSGSAELGNAYADIVASNLGADLEASNSFGSIIIEEVDGPVDLVTSNAIINLSLTSDFQGGSSVTNTNGKIHLKIHEQPDLSVLIHTTGGTITSSFPLTVIDERHAKTAELILGDGGEVLDLSGVSTAVIIGRY